MATSLASLQHVTQGKNESVRQYMARFAKVCLNIPNLHPVVAMHALTVWLKLGLFLNALFVERPSNMDVLWARATKYNIIEENTEAARRIEVPVITSRLKRKRVGRYDTYTPLNASRDIVIQEAYGVGLLTTTYTKSSLCRSNIIKILVTLPKNVLRYVTSLKTW